MKWRYISRSLDIQYRPQHRNASSWNTAKWWERRQGWMWAPVYKHRLQSAPRGQNIHASSLVQMMDNRTGEPNGWLMTWGLPEGFNASAIAKWWRIRYNAWLYTYWWWHIRLYIQMERGIEVLILNINCAHTRNQYLTDKPTKCTILCLTFWGCMSSRQRNVSNSLC